MDSISVAVHILNSERKTAMDWTFIEIHNHASLSYEQFISKILSGEFSDCKLKESLCPFCRCVGPDEKLPNRP